MKTIAPTLADCSEVTEVEPETIELFVLGNSWFARSNAPLVRQLFGTDTIATAFMAGCPAGEVLARISALNPAARVVLG